MHRLLKSQLTRCTKSDGVLDLDRFKALIDEAYDQFDRERSRADRATQLMIEEVEQARVREEAARLKREQQEAEAKVLRERQQVAEAASRAKSSFLAVMSHEIRTPMNAVLGLTSALLDTPLNGDQKKMLQTIHQSGDNLLSILNDILDYSKLEAGAMTFENIVFSAQEIGEAALSIMAPRAKAKGIDIFQVNDWHLPSGLLGDAGRLRQVLINLVSNAVKFTSTGTVSITCRSIQHEDDKAEIEWRVSDTGAGIAPEQVDNLFKDFVQADSSINRRYGGTGLGLSICKRIVSQMGGSIGIASTGSGGTTVRFTVKLPVVSVERRTLTKIEMDPSEDLRKYIEKLGRPLSILIVDDNPTNRLVASKLLQGLNVTINTAADGAEAVESATRFNPDVILMDMRMPEMDGLEATRILRRNGLQIPIIAFTANAFQDDRESATAAGMDDFVSKPVKKPLLFASITKALQNAGTREAATPLSSTMSDTQASKEVPAPEIEPAVFDQSDYRELESAIGSEAMRESVDMFFEDTEAMIRAMNPDELERSRIAIGRNAHSIKGTAAQFGFKSLSATAKHLERVAGEIDVRDFTKICGKLQKDLSLARAALEADRMSLAA